MGYFGRSDYGNDLNAFLAKRDTRFLSRSKKFPSTITLETLDREITKWVGDLKLVISDRDVPILFVLPEKWASFRQTWKVVDVDRNIVYPAITVKRGNMEKPKEKANVPHGKFITYIEPTIVGGGKATYTYYKIPQPSRVNVEYELHILNNYVQDDNYINEEIMRQFDSNQSFINYNGHYMPLEITNIANETNYDEPDGERIIHTAISILLKGYLLDGNDFEEKTGVASILVDIQEDVG